MTNSPPLPRLAHFPVAFFSMVMGLAGLSIAWHKAQQIFRIDLPIASILLATAALAFLVLGVIYLAKLIYYRETVVKELAHPIQLNFFPTISMSLLLLGIATLEHWPGLAEVLWIIGATSQLMLTLYVLNVWIHHERFEVHHVNPAWFIPVVGNVLVPIAGARLGFIETSWFFLAIGLLFWLLLFAIVLQRFIFHPSLPDRLMPTFFILIAPPAVGFIAYLQLSGGLDALARILYYAGLFLTLLLMVQVERFLRLEFYLSWWAYSFPLAAMTTATLIMFQQTQALAFAIIGWTLLSLVSLGVVYLLYRTAHAVKAGEICVPAH
jgi:tellurite resistance protein